MNGESMGPKSISGATKSPGGVRLAARADDTGRDAIERARERFADGEDGVQSVRAEILLSWYRCRDEYRVDPGLSMAPPADEQGHRHGLTHDVVLASLSGTATAIVAETEALAAIMTVTDGDGCVVASHGNAEALRRAEASNLTPWAAWPERVTGTNGMGTALASKGGPVFVRGPEHWCAGFRGLSCAGIAIRDPLTDEPLASVNISCYSGELPPAAGDWLLSLTEPARRLLSSHARSGGDRLLEAFAQAERQAPAPLAALDSAGNVVVASEKGGLLLGVPARVPVTDADRRPVSPVSGLRELAAESFAQARRDPEWNGSTQLASPFSAEPVPVSVRPVFGGGSVTGLLIVPAAAADLTVPLPSHPPRESPPAWIAGRQDGRLLLIPLREVRFAEADGNTIWLVSDRGKLKATMRGLDVLERKLADSGFIRLHRGVLANLSRISEIRPARDGTMLAVTDARPSETLPVSRRYAVRLRQVLSI